MKELTIYIDRLRGGHEHTVEETLSPAFLAIDEEDLQFADPVHIHFQAYLAEDHLVVHLDVDTAATIPCAICNEPVHLPIVLKHHTLTTLLSEIKGAIYDITEEVREAILLQIPLFTECNSGKCPERDNIKKFLSKENDTSSEPTHFPFSDFL